MITWEGGFGEGKLFRKYQIKYGKGKVCIFKETGKSTVRTQKVRGQFLQMIRQDDTRFELRENAKWFRLNSKHNGNLGNTFK